MAGELHECDASLFEQHEAQVRSYCRKFDAVFASAHGAWLTDVRGAKYLDFFLGAGALNYGHNHPVIKQLVIEYLQGDGVVHSLDMYTAAKHRLLDVLYATILRPRGLGHLKVAFPGPTGTNAVEMALKLARRATGRQQVIAFTHAYHGMSAGSLALAGNRDFRRAGGVHLPGVARFPYDGYLGPDIDTAELLEKMLDDPSSGIDEPAAIIIETIQADGGLAVASPRWLRALANIARKHDAALVIDDIQAGCGRTGAFFSFESAGLAPDIVCLSKSLSGLGLPLSMLLLHPRLDVLRPGEHSGTFRGHNLAFVGAAAALGFWGNDEFTSTAGNAAQALGAGVRELVSRHPEGGAHIRGTGAMLGVGWQDHAMAARVSQAAFANGLIAETCGPHDEVIKLYPPLTISESDLAEGLGRIDAAMTCAAGAGASEPLAVRARSRR